jgi:hypothetical protein
VSAVIRLDHMIRETLERPYRDLVTRSTGPAVRQRVVNALQGTAERDALLDFTEIGVVDFSCADEVVAKLLFAADELPVTRVLLRGLSDDHVEAIEHVLRHHGLVIVAICLSSNEPRILGDVASDDRDVFGVLAAAGRGAAAMVAARLAWPESRAAHSLDTLAGRRCILAHADATYELGAVA